MTHHERMIAAIKGHKTDMLPWAPRMDLWYIALRERGELPAQYLGMNTAEISDELGVACHSVRADYTLKRDPQDLLLRGLGIDNHPDYPYSVHLRDLPVSFTYDDENYRTNIETPAGPVTIHLQQSKSMTREGISLPFVKSYAIQSARDFEAVAQVFEHLEVVPTPQAYDSYHDRIGDRGLAVAGGAIGASPMHLILHDLVAMDQFFYLYADERKAISRLAERMAPFYEAVTDALLQCRAEVVFWGGNYDQDLTWPSFFADEIAPWLKHIAAKAHDAGKFLLTHTDGENRDLMPLYPECRFDVAESVCPSPMTQCTLAESRKGFGSGTTVWGGIPAVCLLDASMDDAAFERFVDETFGALDGGDHLILGVSDNVPPDANMERLRRITELANGFGPVG